MLVKYILEDRKIVLVKKVGVIFLLNVLIFMFNKEN